MFSVPYDHIQTSAVALVSQRTSAERSAVSRVPCVCVLEDAAYLSSPLPPVCTPSRVPTLELRGFLVSVVVQNQTDTAVSGKGSTPAAEVHC